MRLLEVRLALVGRVEPARGPITEIYFRFHAELAPAGDPTADPFLPTLLVPSIVTGEPLFLDPPVSAQRLRRATRVQDILTTWYPMRRRTAVAAPARPVPAGGPPLRGGAVGAFFSAGVDSCYTLLKSRLGWPSPADPVTHLIFVKGFDAPLSDAAGLAASEARIRALATRYDCEPIVVETNLRDVLAAPWGELYHGSALAAVGHLGTARSFPDRLPAGYARPFGPDRRFLQRTLNQARLTGDPGLVRTLSRRARALDRRLGLNLALRALPLGETLLDVRATLTRRWRGWRGPWGTR